MEPGAPRSLWIYSSLGMRGCSSPLGLTTGDVLDWQISASSSYPATWDAGCQVKYARLHQPNGRAWCAGRRAAGEWVLVNLGVPAKVTGVLTQGKGDDEEWVTSFELSYSLDAYHWHFARDIYNNKKTVLNGLRSVGDGTTATQRRPSLTAQSLLAKVKTSLDAPPSPGC
ncbi:lactadherin-like [Eriocheir sinensis]|uniref:lactadherin-like n=1 Tax=Eriocheir sinensis TaxID=95602 RepID=UPI0021CA04F6|nr:lactadherin-like [Eriocheir sinensis]